MTLHQANDIIARRYRIVTPLGKGGMGITYEAEDLKNYQRVGVKVVSLREAKDWKILELFEREARVIANLNHPQIPKYLNYFYIDTQLDRRFYLIRELVWGNSLATWVKKGWHPTETQVKQVAIQILKILSYLHQLNPSIIHRDIKPENIILQPDGKIFLVDFGAVQDIYRNTISLSGTFVGTIGYIPPEQLRGKAYCASDLYSLGGTLLYLLTHRSPDKLPQKRMKINFRSCVNISPKFADWLEVILEPMWEDRFKSAREALNVLSNKSEIVYNDYYGVKSSQTKPVGSRVILQKTSRSLIVDIPSVGSSKAGQIFLCFITILLCIMYSSLLVLFNGNIILMMTFVCLLLFRLYLGNYIKITNNEFVINWNFLFFSRSITAKTKDIKKVYLETDVYGENTTYITFDLLKAQHQQKYQFGYMLSQKERKWLFAEIKEFLEQLKLQESLKKPE